MAQVEIYTTRYCFYCQSAKALLNRKGIAFTETDVSGDPHGRRQMIQRSNRRIPQPQISARPPHAGGFDDPSALDRAGRLDPLLAAEGIAAPPAQQGFPA